MKKTAITLLAAGALTIGLAGYTFIDDAELPTQPEGEGIGYISFHISSDEAISQVVNKDELYEDDFTPDNAVCPNHLSRAALFFDDKGNFFGMSNLHAVKNVEDVVDKSDEGAEQYFAYVTRWRNTNTHATSRPSRVLVILNANPRELNELAETLVQKGNGALDYFTQIETEAFAVSPAPENGLYTYRDQNFYTMSNSPCGDNSVTEVTYFDYNTNLHATAEQAIDNPVDIHVKKLLAKYNVDNAQPQDELAGINADDASALLSKVDKPQPNKKNRPART